MSDGSFPGAGTHVGVVGLGLIGGSLARDLVSLGCRVTGYDTDEESLKAAGAAEIVQPSDASLSGFDGIDVAVFAVPVDALGDALRAATPRLDSARLILDVGSTKRSALVAAEQAGVADRFVGAHPMAGDHHSGWSASRTGLFDDAQVYLCPTKNTGPAALDLAHQLWFAIRACPQVTDAEAHDKLVAYTSHLPHAVSQALAQVLAHRGIARAELGPGGRDVTRLAASNPELWTAIMLDNADVLIAALAAFRGQLDGLTNALSARDATAVRSYLSAARDWAS